MPVNRHNVQYRLTFVAEAGVECDNGQPAKVVGERVGIANMIQLLEAELKKEYETSDWLEPDAGYTWVVQENNRTLQRLQDGEISVAAFSIPYGALVVC